jgi:hypothetical protein
VINKFKMAKHLAVTITDASLTVTRKQDQIDAEAALGGWCFSRGGDPGEPTGLG